MLIRSPKSSYKKGICNFKPKGIMMISIIILGKRKTGRGRGKKQSPFLTNEFRLGGGLVRMYPDHPALSKQMNSKAIIAGLPFKASSWGFLINGGSTRSSGITRE